MDCTGSTPSGSQYWVNDRLYPRRPFIYQPNASRIDAALKAAPKTAELFYEVELEPATWEDRKPVRPAAPAAAAMPAARRGLSQRIWRQGG